MAKSPSSVSFEFDPKAGAITAPVRLSSGRHSIDTQLVFDTGASVTMISWVIATKLKLNPAKVRKKVGFNSASGYVEAPMVAIKNMAVHGVEVKNVDAIVHDLPEEARVDGLLGLNFLNEFVINIDFQKGNIKLTKF